MGSNNPWKPGLIPRLIYLRGPRIVIHLLFLAKHTATRLLMDAWNAWNAEHAPMEIFHGELVSISRPTDSDKRNKVKPPRHGRRVPSHS